MYVWALNGKNLLRWRKAQSIQSNVFYLGKRLEGSQDSTRYSPVIHFTSGKLPKKITVTMGRESLKCESSLAKRRAGEAL